MSQRVKLNVGGFHFETTVATLTRDPESMLAKMIEQPNEKKLIEEGKELFIDRDGTHFAYILNYLRDGERMILPAGKAHIRQRLIREADFYQLPGLEKFAQSNGAFKVGDLVQLHGDVGHRFFDLIAYGGNKRACWMCQKITDRTPSGLKQKHGHKPDYQLIFGRIDEISDICAEVKFAFSIYYQAYTGVAFTEPDIVYNIHIPLMFLRLA